MSDLKIFCPSKGRADKVLTTTILKKLTLLVTHDELELYGDQNKDVEVIATPPSVKGITATKQWLLDNFDNWFTIDDDVWQVRRMYENEEDKAWVQDEDEIYDIIVRLYEMAKMSGAYLFGFGKERNPLMYHSHKPFQFNGYVNSSHFGVCEGHNLEYNLDMNEGEDHWLSCYNAYKHRFCLIDTRYSFFTKDNFMAQGGCNDYRTVEDMKKNTIILRQHFGDAIRLKHASHTRKNVNKGERSINIPL